MLCKEVNFREIDRQLIEIKDENAKNQLKDRVNFTNESDSLLFFCYIDSSAGLTFDFLCPFNSKNNEYFEIENKNFRHFFRKGFFNEVEINILSDEILKSEKLKEYIYSIIEHYENDDNKIHTRKCCDIDHLRQIDYPDDVLVYICKDGLDTERIWVRLNKVVDGKLYGTLLNEPNSYFGIHRNEEIKMEFFKGNDNKYNLIYICK